MALEIFAIEQTNARGEVANRERYLFRSAAGSASKECQIRNAICSFVNWNNVFVGDTLHIVEVDPTKE